MPISHFMSKLTLASDPCCLGCHGNHWPHWAAMLPRKEEEWKKKKRGGVTRQTDGHYEIHPCPSLPSVRRTARTSRATHVATSVIAQKEKSTR